jgi:hypothetical protein
LDLLIDCLIHHLKLSVKRRCRYAFIIYLYHCNITILKQLSEKFLDKNTEYKMTVYADGEDANWKTNPKSYRIKTIKANVNSVLKLLLAPGGVAEISIKAVKK